LAILAHLAAHTSRIRLGSAAVLLPFRDPILVAEEAAAGEAGCVGARDAISEVKTTRTGDAVVVALAGTIAE